MTRWQYYENYKISLKKDKYKKQTLISLATMFSMSETKHFIASAKTH